MKTIVCAGLAFLFLAASAGAQTPPTPPPGAPEAPPVAGKTGDEPRAIGPAKSARFRLQVGRVFLGLTCPDDEPLKACADFAMELLDKAESMQKH